MRQTCEVAKMDEIELTQWIKKLQEEDALWKFYKSKVWMNLKEEIIKENHGECMRCKQLGKITLADTVHHVQWVRKHPRLALTKMYEYKGKQYVNLMPVCKQCHNILHPEKLKKKEEFINEERW